MIHTTRFIAFFISIFVIFAAAPKAALAFDWPADTDMSVKLQVISREISNVQVMIAGIFSQRPINAQAYIAVDLSDNKVLLQKNSTLAYPIASTAKLMNAVIARENIDMDETITLTDKMLAPEGSSPAIYKELEITAGELLRAALVQSVNDAAESLAYFIGKDAYLEKMNLKARKIGMTNTNYYDTCGLDPETKASAVDMTKLLAYIYKNDPEILEITKDNDFWLPNEDGETLRFLNLNDFYIFPEFVGGKSGYLVEAGNTFAAVFKIAKKPVAIVLLNSGNYRSDIFRIINLIDK